MLSIGDHLYLEGYRSLIKKSLNLDELLIDDNNNKPLGLQFSTYQKQTPIYKFFGFNKHFVFLLSLKKIDFHRLILLKRPRTFL